MAPEPRDSYVVLGIPRDASLLEIARARRRLAKRFHPDVAPGDRAVRQMRAVNAAWQILSDPMARRAWDRADSERRADFSPARTSTVDPAWRYGGARTSVWRQPEPASEGRVGWFVLGGISLLLALILIAGLAAAVDGPSMPGRDSPMLQDNLDVPGG